MIREYFARVGVEVDETTLKDVDNFLKEIETRLSALNNLAKPFKGGIGGGKKGEASSRKDNIKSLEEETKATEKRVESVKKETIAVAALAKEVKKYNNIKWKGLDRRFNKRKVKENLSWLPEVGVAPPKSRYTGAFKPDNITWRPLDRDLNKRLIASRLSYIPQGTPSSRRIYDGVFLQELHKNVNSFKSSLNEATRAVDKFKGVSGRDKFFAKSAGIELGAQLKSRGVQAQHIARAVAAEQDRVLNTRKQINSREKESLRIARELVQANRENQRVSSQRVRTLEREVQALNKQLVARRRNQVSEARISRGNWLATGGIAGAISTMGARAIPFVGGAWGMSRLRSSMTDVMLAPLTAQAVFEAAGYSELEAKESWEWYRDLADRVGFSYMRNAQEFNTFMSNAFAAELDIDESQLLFEGLSEYSQAMSLTPYRKQLVFNAMTQMLGKGQVMSEELKRQMAQSLPATLDIFAEVWAEHSGSGLTGSAAIADLYSSMEKGQIVTSEIAVALAEEMKRRAAFKIDVMSRTSQAESQRTENILARMLEDFQKSGGEEGFLEFFFNLNRSLSSSRNIVKALGEAFGFFGRQMRHVGNLVTSTNKIFDNFNKSLGWSDTGIQKLYGSLLALGVMVSTRWGKNFMLFTLVFALFEDLVATLSGNKDIKTLSDWIGEFLELDDNSMAMKAIKGLVASIEVLILLLTARTVSRALFLPSILKKEIPLITSMVTRMGRAFKSLGAMALRALTPILGVLAPILMTLALIDTAVQQFNKEEGHYEAYASSLGLDYNTLSGKIVTHIASFFEDLGNTLTFGLAGKFGDWLSENINLVEFHAAVYEKVEEYLVNPVMDFLKYVGEIVKLSTYQFAQDSLASVGIRPKWLEERVNSMREELGIEDVGQSSSVKGRASNILLDGPGGIAKRFREATFRAVRAVSEDVYDTYRNTLLSPTGALNTMLRFSPFSSPRNTWNSHLGRSRGDDSNIVIPFNTPENLVPETKDTQRANQIEVNVNVGGIEVNSEGDGLDLARGLAVHLSREIQYNIDKVV